MGFLDDELHLIRITNEDLQCKDCKHKYYDTVIFGNTSKCEMYEIKPNGILLNKKKCEHYNSITE